MRYLVAERGFRTLAWEDDWTLGVQINDYIHGRRGDRDALVGQMSREARTEQVASLLSWLREYNRTHREKVTFVGAEYFATRPLAYHAVRDYVARRAPQHLPAVNAYLEQICPPDDNMGEYLDFYRNVDDQTPYLRAANALFDLVDNLDHRPADRDYALVLHHARQIRSFYTAFSIPEDEVLAYRDARAAENLRWWQQYSSDRVIYWAAAAHTTTAPEVTINIGPNPAARFAPVGSYLDRWYTHRYITIGYTFDQGTMFVPPAQQATLPPALPNWFEAPLAQVSHDSFYLDLTRPTPRPARDWLTQPTVTRGLPEAGTTSTITGGTPQHWYDALHHTQNVTASTPLTNR
ncbi:erythromycin esterase family protein [Asanoa siamensis]|uniref:erythromycin esterase family protein n=1 Tax=Asanoa siamensis TaxID=926357 RepID=UPI0019431BF1|nr:erythromycin esterase family protein [Asanoa siamensis]